MTVVPFHIHPKTSDGLWHADEMSQLLSIFAAHEAQGEASDWDTGETESRDPQFYILGVQPDLDCVVSITRLGNDYVLEDGHGSVVAEGRSLSVIADKAVQLTSSIRKSAFLARIAVAWIAAREFLEEKVEPLMAEPVEVATHFFPQLAALA
jgi:hypothetical protein